MCSSPLLPPREGEVGAWVVGFLLAPSESRRGCWRPLEEDTETPSRVTLIPGARDWKTRKSVRTLRASSPKRCRPVVLNGVLGLPRPSRPRRAVLGTQVKPFKQRKRPCLAALAAVLLAGARHASPPMPFGISLNFCPTARLGVPQAMGAAVGPVGGSAVVLPAWFKRFGPWGAPVQTGAFTLMWTLATLDRGGWGTRHALSGPCSACNAPRSAPAPSIPALAAWTMLGPAGREHPPHNSRQLQGSDPPCFLTHAPASCPYCPPPPPTRHTGVFSSASVMGGTGGIMV